MAQPLFNTYLYSSSTGSGPLIIRTGPGALGVVTINQIGSTASIVTILDSTTTSTTGSARVIADLTPGSLGSFAYFTPVANGLTVCCNTSSTAELTITWA